MIADFATHFVSTAVRNGVIDAVSRSLASELEAPETCDNVSVEQGVEVHDKSLSSTILADSRISVKKDDTPTSVPEDVAVLEGRAAVSESHAKSAIPVPCSSVKKHVISSSSDFQTFVPLKGGEGTVASESKVKASDSSQKFASGRSHLVHTALPRRALLGKAYPRSGTLVRQQSVSVHPEDEETKVAEKPLKPLEVTLQLPAASEERLDQSVTRGSKNSEVSKLGGGDSQCNVQTHRQAKLQSYSRPVRSGSEGPELSQRLIDGSSPPCPSADSGYLSLLSASGHLDSDTVFPYSPVSRGDQSPRKLEFQHGDISARTTPMTGKILGKEKSEDLVAVKTSQTEQAQHSGVIFSEKRTQSGERELFAMLKTKTIYLEAPPLHSSEHLDTKTSQGAKQGNLPYKSSSQVHRLSEIESAAKPKKNTTSTERQAASVLQKAKLQGSAIPRIRTKSDPTGRKSPTSAESSKASRGQGPSKKTESKQVREKSKRSVRAVSEPSDVVKGKSTTGREVKPGDPQTKRSESKVSKGETRSQRMESRFERIHKEVPQRGRGSKSALSPTKQSQAMRYTSNRRLSNTSGEGADGSLSSSPVSAQPSSGASGPPKSSGIPKYREPIRKSWLPTAPQGKTSCSHLKISKSETVTGTKEKSDKEKKRHHSHQTQVGGSHRHVKQEPPFKPHKSRYVFSDVAAPLTDKKSKKHREEPTRSKSESNTPRRHHHHDSLKHQKEQGEQRKSSKADQDTKRKSRVKVCSQIRKFVNSMADRIVSEAVLEGADIVAQRSLISSLPSGQMGEISEEVYSWFSNKIISQVFSHILHGLETRDHHFQSSPVQLQPEGGLMSLRQLREIGASSGSPGEELNGRMLSSPVDASATDSMARSLSPLSISCLTPTRTTTAASPSSPNLKSPVAFGGAGSESVAGTSHKRQGSLKMVKFQMGSGRRGSDADAAETVEVPLPHSHPHPAASPVSPSSTSSLHVPTSPVGLFTIKPNTNIPIPTRRRSSFDVASLSPPSSIRAMGFSPPLRPTPLSASSLFAGSKSEGYGSSAAICDPVGSLSKDFGSVDLSLDIYQVAANIVDQVFQNISDNVRDPRGYLTALSPGDEGKWQR